MTLLDSIALCIAIVVTCTLPLWLGAINDWLDIRSYNKRHSVKLKHTSIFTQGKRYREWYLSNFFDKKETHTHD